MASKTKSNPLRLRFSIAVYRTFKLVFIAFTIWSLYSLFIVLLYTDKHRFIILATISKLLLLAALVIYVFNKFSVVINSLISTTSILLKSDINKLFFLVDNNPFIKSLLCKNTCLAPAGISWFHRTF